jgi:hypothetical protein
MAHIPQTSQVAQTGHLLPMYYPPIPVQTHTLASQLNIRNVNGQDVVKLALVAMLQFPEETPGRALAS